LAVVQLARVPLGIGTTTPASAASSGGTTLTIRGSGFQTGVKATIGGKSGAATLVDMNTVKIITPALNVGKHAITIINTDGETTSLDAGFTAN